MNLILSEKSNLSQYNNRLFLVLISLFHQQTVIGFAFRSCPGLCEGSEGGSLVIGHLSILRKIDRFTPTLKGANRFFWILPLGQG